MMILTGRSQHGVCGAFMALAGLVGCSPMASDGDRLGEPFAFETVPPAEAGEIDETAALTIALQSIRAKTDESQEGRLLRGVHPKSHGCVMARFVVNDDIEEKYQVGLFAQPGMKKGYDAWIRFSNASVLREDDLKADNDDVRQNGSRGMAIKVMDVEGDMLSKDDGQSNQDFLMINTPEFAFANVRDYLRLDRILALSEKGNDAALFFLPLNLDALGEPKDGESPETTKERSKLKAIMEAIPAFNEFTSVDLGGTKASIGVIKGKIERKTVRNPMQVEYFGAAPFWFGAGQAMRFSAAPCEATDQAPFVDVTPDNPSKDYLGEALTQTMKGKKDVCYDFKVQLRSVDADDPKLEELKLEDATKIWSDDGTGYVNVARITIKVPQKPDTDEAIEHCEKLAFSPWHSLTDHQPLGGINRLRRKVYSDSAGHRGAGGY